MSISEETIESEKGDKRDVRAGKDCGSVLSPHDAK